MFRRYMLPAICKYRLNMIANQHPAQMTLYVLLEDVKRLGGLCHLRGIVQAEQLKGKLTLEFCNGKTIYIAASGSPLELKFFSDPPV